MRTARLKQYECNLTVLLALIPAIAVISLMIFIAKDGFAAPDCPTNAGRMKVVTEITPSGQEKLIRLAYEAERRSINTQLQDIPRSPKPIGASSKDPACRGNNLYKLSEEQAKKRCFGILPVALWPKNPGDPRDEDKRGLDYLEPLHIDLTQLTVPSLQLAQEPKIHCEKNVCDVQASIDQLNVGFDFSAQSVNDNCKQIALKNVRLGLDRAKPKAAMHVRFRFTENLASPIEVLWDKSELNVPAESIAYTAQSLPPGQDGVCAKGPGLQSGSSAMLGNLALHRQVIVDKILSEMKSKVLREFATQTIEKVAKANGLGTQRQIQTAFPNIRNIEDTQAMQGAVEDHIALSGTYVATLRSARSAADVANASPTGALKAKLDDFIRSFKHSGSPEARELIKKVASAWSQAAAQIQRMLGSNLAGIPAAEQAQAQQALRDDLSEILNSLNAIKTYEGQLHVDFESSEREQISYMITALQANQIEGNIKFALSACFLCRQIAGSPGGPEPQGQFRRDIPHDLAFETDRSSINQALQAMQMGGNLDICVIQGAKRACDSSRPNDNKTTVHFSRPPELGWDEQGVPFIHIRGIQLSNQNSMLANFGKTMQADATIPGSFSLENGGKTLKFNPIGSRIRIENANFQDAEWGRLAAWAAEQLSDSSFVHSKIKSALTQKVGVPDNVALTGLDFSKPSLLGIYVNLPTDPRVMLPTDPQREPAQSLAPEIRRARR